jgi:hypothetical protein
MPHSYDRVPFGIAVYWRILLSFAIFAIAILVAKTAMFRFILSRSAFGSPA